MNALPVVVIKPSSKWVPLRLRDLWNFRELMFFLVWRDIKVRYKQTILGASWAVIQPVMATIIFSLFFGRLAKIPSDGIPYPVFAFCGLLPWQLFAFALSESSNSLVSNRQLVTKVYFPRLIIPFSAVLAGLVDFLIAFVVLLILMFYFGVVPTAAIITLPFFVGMTILTALSFGIWLSALNVEYRDIRYIIPFLTQFWLFLTPIAYPSSLVPERWRVLFGLNPMTGVVEGFRWALLGKEGGPGNLLIVSMIVVVLLFVSGLYYFRRVEATFADNL